MLSSGADVIIWEEILSCRTKCYHLELMFIWDIMLSSGMKSYHLELMLSSRTKCYHLELNVIIWDAMLSSGANVIIWSFCYHLEQMLSSGVIM